MKDPETGRMIPRQPEYTWPLAGPDIPFWVARRVHNGYTDRMAPKDVAFKLRN